MAALLASRWSGRSKPRMRAARAVAWRGRVKEIGSRPGGALREDAPILECLRAVDAHLGIRSHLDCSSTDANIPLSLGLPAVSIGAGGQGGGAHTAAEWFQPEGRELGLRRILLALCCLLLAWAERSTFAEDIRLCQRNEILRRPETSYSRRPGRQGLS